MIKNLHKRVNVAHLILTFLCYFLIKDEQRKIYHKKGEKNVFDQKVSASSESIMLLIVEGHSTDLDLFMMLCNVLNPTPQNGLWCGDLTSRSYER